jgi:hypothetical protein
VTAALGPSNLIGSNSGLPTLVFACTRPPCRYTPDPTWTPYLSPTPFHPSYTSGHQGTTGAWLAVSHGWGEEIAEASCWALSLVERLRPLCMAWATPVTLPAVCI